MDVLKKVAVLSVLLLLFSSCASGREVSGAPPVGIQAPAETQIPDDTESPDETQTPVAVEEEMPPPLIPPSSPTNLWPFETEHPIPEDERLWLRNENGDILYPGMSRLECENVLGEAIEEGKQAVAGDSIITRSIHDVVLIIEVSSSWSLGEIAVGDNVEKVREIFKENNLDDIKNFQEGYRLPINFIKVYLEGDYSVGFFYGNDGIITGLVSIFYL